MKYLIIFLMSLFFNKAYSEKDTEVQALVDFDDAQHELIMVPLEDDSDQDYLYFNNALVVNLDAKKDFQTRHFLFVDQKRTGNFTNVVIHNDLSLCFHPQDFSTFKKNLPTDEKQKLIYLHTYCSKSVQFKRNQVHAFFEKYKSKKNKYSIASGIAVGTVVSSGVLGILQFLSPASSLPIFMVRLVSGVYAFFKSSYKTSEIVEEKYSKKIKTIKSLIHELQEGRGDFFIVSPKIHEKEMVEFFQSFSEFVNE